MRVFVAGGSGVLGRAAVEALAAAGHEVKATARTAEKAEAVRAAGAEAVQVDLFDESTVRDALWNCQAVVNLATKVHKFGFYLARRKSWWKENEKLMHEAAPMLARLAVEAGAEVFVQASVTYLYGNGGEHWITEEAPVEPAWLSLETMAQGEKAADAFAGLNRRAVKLRFGHLYGPAAPSTVETGKMIRLQTLGVPGKGSGYISTIHSTDAGAAVAAALTAPGGTYNVVDDEPLTWRVYATTIAKAVDVSVLQYPPGQPQWLFKLSYGGPAVYMLRSHRISNGRFKTATGWSPRFPSVREGWKQVVDTAEWPFWMGDLEKG